MELWKIHKYCESATLSELRDREAKLILMIDKGKGKETNAEKALEILREYIDLKRLFDED